MLLQDRRLLALVILFCLTGVVACSDTQQPTFPVAQVGLADPTQIAQLPQTIDDEFARVARDEIPGFAGHYLDEHSNSVVYLVDVSARAAAGSYAAQVRSSAGLAVGPVTIRQAKYDFLQLRQWRDQLSSVLTMDGVAILDIDETANKIFIGVVDQEATRTVAELIAGQRVPEDAVLVEIRDRPVRAQDLELTDHERPVQAGFLIENEASELHRCTLGFNARQSSQRVFTTASHCSELESQLDYSIEYQEDDVAGREIGYEANDVEPYLCSWFPVLCRFADVSTFRYYGSVNDRKGYIARTMDYGENERGSRVVNPSTPEFPIEYKSGTVLVGHWVNKVGRTSGWTRGPVTRTCVWLIYDDPPAWYRCQNEVDLHVEGGDSGSPVFLAGGITGTWNESQSDANLVGVLSGREGTEIMFYSQMNYVEYELGFFDVWTPSPPPPMSVTINGPDTWPAYQQVTVNALVSWGTPPFTYAWKVNGATACGNNYWCSAHMGAPYSQTFFQVTVTDADQDQATDYHIVTAQ